MHNRRKESVLAWVLREIVKAKFKINIALKATSGKGKKTTYGPDSSCIYEASFSLGCSSSTHSPSTNRPIECPHCKLVLWSYNLQCHYSEKHQTSIAPDIDAQEIIRIQNFKK